MDINNILNTFNNYHTFKSRNWYKEIGIVGYFHSLSAQTLEKDESEFPVFIREKKKAQRLIGSMCLILCRV